MIDLAFWLRVSGHLSILFWLTQVVKYGEVLDTYEDISDESIGPLKLVAAIHHEVDGLTLVCSSHKVMTALIIVSKCCSVVFSPIS
jgi:hypothetical protein